MIKIENTEVFGIEHAIRGMRNPLNSWKNSDSYWTHIEDSETLETANYQFHLGDKDLKLAKTLAESGNDHGKFLRFIICYCDITAPLYWWKEADTYRMGVEKNSCSTMHKIQAKKFEMDDFSTEHLNDESKKVFGLVIYELNKNRDLYNCGNEKEDWWQLIELLPSSYNQKRTMMMSYAALRNMYNARKNHKLDDWHKFCDWVETLPYSELITGGTDE